MKTPTPLWPEQFPYPKWYLDAVSGNIGWDHVEVQNGSGRLKGILPYQLRKKRGLTLLSAPPLAPRLGPYLYEPEELQHEWQRLRFYHDALQSLNDALPKADYYRVAWQYDLQYGLPWQQMGWQQRVRYSYVLSLQTSIETIFEGFRPTLRNRIRKAETQLTIEPTSDWQTVDRLMKLVFQHRNSPNQISTEMLERIYLASNKNKAVQLWIAKDAQDKVHAALWLQFDHQHAYNLLPSSDPALRQSGAVPLLLWHAIRWAKDHGLTHFDFEGSHLPGVEPFFRSFGAEAWPYYEFIKGKPWLLALRQLRGRL